MRKMKFIQDGLLADQNFTKPKTVENAAYALIQMPLTPVRNY